MINLWHKIRVLMLARICQKTCYWPFIILSKKNPLRYQMRPMMIWCLPFFHPTKRVGLSSKVVLGRIGKEDGLSWVMAVSIISNILLKMCLKVVLYFKREKVFFVFHSHTQFLYFLFQGIIPLDYVDVRVLHGDSDRPWQFEIYNVDESRDKDMVKGCKLDKTGTVVMGNHRVYRKDCYLLDNKVRPKKCTLMLFWITGWVQAVRRRGIPGFLVLITSSRKWEWTNIWKKRKNGIWV